MINREALLKEWTSKIEELGIPFIIPPKFRDNIRNQIVVFFHPRFCLLINPFKVNEILDLEWNTVNSQIHCPLFILSGYDVVFKPNKIEEIKPLIIKTLKRLINQECKELTEKQQFLKSIL